MILGLDLSETGSIRFDSILLLVIPPLSNERTLNLNYYILKKNEREREREREREIIIEIKLDLAEILAVITLASLVTSMEHK